MDIDVHECSKGILENYPRLFPHVSDLFLISLHPPFTLNSWQAVSSPLWQLRLSAYNWSHWGCSQPCLRDFSPHSNSFLDRLSQIVLPILILSSHVLADTLAKLGLEWNNMSLKIIISQYLFLFCSSLCSI